MGFFAKVKQWMGIGGVKMEIQSDAQFPAGQGTGTVAGKILFTSKSDQHVTKVDVKVIEEKSTGSGAEKSTREYDLGKVTIPNEFDIKAGESKTIDFQVPFKVVKSMTDAMKDKGGALGALGKMGSFVNNEKTFYYITASGSVKGTAMGPSAKKPIQLV
jgi:hypothetical protein